MVKYLYIHMNAIQLAGSQAQLFILLKYSEKRMNSLNS